MSGTEQTYYMTEADIQKDSSQASKAHGGNVPAGSEAAMNQSILDKAEKDKASLIAERQANLPLPDAPPGPSDFNSADARTVNVGSGGENASKFSYGDDALRGPATGDSAFRTDGDELKTNTQGTGVGREAVEGLSGLPNDAVSQGKKNSAGLADTTNTDSAAEKAASGA